MALMQGQYQSYDVDRNVVLFTMVNGADEVPCAISASAMDDLDGSKSTRANGREAQFLRLRERIEARAMRKFADGELEGRPSGIILRSLDFRS